MGRKQPSVEIISFLPDDFFNKRINEPFIRFIMEHILEESEWQPGNPDKGEPDYFCNGIPIEFTLVADTKKTDSFVMRMKQGHFESHDVETEVFNYIAERIADKATKNYSVGNVHLCMLCMLDMFGWVAGEYGSVFHELLDYKRKEFFKYLKEYYIDTGKFSNVFILFPDMCAKWWMFDVKTDVKVSYQLSDDEIKYHKLPFILEKHAYEELMAKSRDVEAKAEKLYNHY